MLSRTLIKILSYGNLIGKCPANSGTYHTKRLLWKPSKWWLPSMHAISCEMQKTENIEQSLVKLLILPFLWGTAAVPSSMTGAGVSTIYFGLSKSWTTSGEKELTRTMDIKSRCENTWLSSIKLSGDPWSNSGPEEEGWDTFAVAARATVVPSIWVPSATFSCRGLQLFAHFQRMVEADGGYEVLIPSLIPVYRECIWTYCSHLNTLS